MKTYVLLAFIFLPQFLFSQWLFAPVGSEWTYSYYDGIFWNTPKTFTISGLDTIDGKVCQKLEGCDTPNFSVDHLYKDPNSQKVFFHKNENGLDTFLLYYDFGAQIGDTMDIGLRNAPFIDDSDGTIYYSIQVRLDSGSMELITVNDLYEELTYVGNLSVVGGPNAIIDCGQKMFYGIGYDGVFIPHAGFFDPPLEFNIRCYNDTNVQLRFVDYDCDYHTYYSEQADFADVGNIWTFSHYKDYKYSPSYYEVMEDTVYQNIRHVFRTHDDETTHFAKWKVDRKKVYFHNEVIDSFLLLFDFGAEAGDTLSIGLKDAYTHLLNDEQFHYDFVVDSVGYEDYCGESLKVWYLQPASEFSEFSFYPNKVIDKIGFVSWFHPYWGLDDLWNDVDGGLRCFEGDGFSCNIREYACDTTYFTMSISEPFSGIEADVFPNPTKDELIIKIEDQRDAFNYSLINWAGRTLLSGVFDNDFQKLDIDDLPAGFYFLVLETKGKQKIIKKVIKE